MASGVVAALAYAGPPPLTLVRTFTSWRFTPGVAAAVAVLGGGYGLGLRRRPASAGAWPRGRTLSFAAGVVIIALVGMSFLGVYDDTLFWVRAVQNIVLLMVVPMLLAMGAPFTLLRDQLPVPARARLSRLLHGKAARLLTFPLVVTVVLTLPLLVLYLSPLYEMTLRSAVASAVAGLVLATTGFVYFWTRFRIDPAPRTDPYGVTLAITVVEMIGDAVLGVVLWLGPLVAAGYYTALARDWGPSIQVDQWLGAGALWIGGDVVGLPFIGVVFARMTREDHQKAVVIDAELDARDAERAAATAEPDGPQEAERPRLWWEDDPELSHRFRRR
ncbi:cytochrome c oxidase assembly protein [Pseudonocardia alaniniphila]|uniref:Cytochrome c oxidase assembly protein n=1 Tax=Pseudonocardia alaniniphila TaxID=75291 RepID=A0ABS9TC60_9PSEU|nr:cytochrome c oxidase assembly protein [Pseudonocardia alaniniphila]MCH6166139.1 cytochrome c oxidase assembly protein [Pseudonocardia alaniniphila]